MSSDQPIPPDPASSKRPGDGESGRAPVERTQLQPGGLRASDADRDQVAQVLSTAFAEGRITREEHDERLDQVMAAKTFDDLVPITQDLVYSGPAPVTAPSADSRIDTSGAAAETDTMVGILGGTTRKGRWRVHRKTQAYALLGGMELDMTEAVFDAPVVEISGFWFLGGMEITVPEGMEVRNHVMGILGGAEIKQSGEHDPNAPVLVLKGVAMLGGVEVKTKRRKRKHLRSD